MVLVIFLEKHNSASDRDKSEIKSDRESQMSISAVRSECSRAFTKKEKYPRGRGTENTSSGGVLLFFFLSPEPMIAKNSVYV